ncbi:diiron oxygenase [Pseudoalteromonas sp. S16_S37]|uniref:diiron oxygenase n=1 Tax=Pseudoalteromonas sp. S16_S37 TaxID=2720228 RepID=UPI0016814B92|nr:diiron oxygenase [Pseudoalteromonas sp. S16_S37]MBD1583919.1 diiron oxygenase [Pseudoalteromonas sp. S16_S37]
MYTNSAEACLNEQTIFKVLSNNWNTRAAVRKERLDLDQYCESSLPEFPISMVPFWDWPEFADVTEETKQRLLAGAWIFYNEHTIMTEDEIVNPLCSKLLKITNLGIDSPKTKQILAQTMVDEQFHILMCLEVCNSARRRFNLESFVVPSSRPIINLKKYISEIEDEHQSLLIQLAYATVTELTINNFLRAISEDKTIQPLNRMNTALHRKDEAGHEAVFKELSATAYSHLTPKNKAFFKRYVEQALHDFANPDSRSWDALLTHLEIPNREAIIAKLEATMYFPDLSEDVLALYKIIEKSQKTSGTTELVS